MRRLVYTPEALKALQLMPRNRVEQVMEKMALYAEKPSALAANVRRLRGYDDVFRLRVGNWRVLFKQNDQEIVVLTVSPRGRAYR
jgi:mRNA interferase RelE/StbE